MKNKIMKAWELSMKGYSKEEVISAISLIYNLHYIKAKVIGEKGYRMTFNQTEN
jgi:hypothetical protein